MENTTSAEFLAEIKLTECIECQKCCHDNPTFILGYNVLSFLFQKSLNSSEISWNDKLQQLCIYKIARKEIKQAAKSFNHWFGHNILAQITISQGGFYHLLVIPKTRGPCMFLESTGCALKQSKPFHCKLYPLLFYQQELYIAKQCPRSENSQDTALISNGVQIILAFKEFAHLHNKEYFQLLLKAQEYWQWPVITFKA